MITLDRGSREEGSSRDSAFLSASTPSFSSSCNFLLVVDSSDTQLQIIILPLSDAFKAPSEDACHASHAHCSALTLVLPQGLGQPLSALDTMSNFILATGLIQRVTNLLSPTVTPFP